MFKRTKQKVAPIALALIGTFAALTTTIPAFGGVEGIVPDSPYSQRDQKKLTPEQQQKVEEAREKRIKELFDVACSSKTSEKDIDKALKEINEIYKEIRFEAIDDLQKQLKDPNLSKDKYIKANRQLGVLIKEMADEAIQEYNRKNAPGRPEKAPAKGKKAEGMQPT